MRKTTKALSGASQDAYFRRVLKAHPSISAGERDRIVQRFRAEIAQLRVRKVARGAPHAVAGDAPPETLSTAMQVSVAPETPPAVAVPAFDPYSPNVIVVMRTSGRDAALAALGAIDDVENLHLLAREQRLNIPGDIESAADLRSAIVTAAERRIANRMAAAS